MKQILCFGDSNTWGLVPGTWNRYGWDTRWTGRLDGMLSGLGYRVVEEGLCGRTTIFDDTQRQGRCGISLISTIIESHNPLEAVVVMLGTNDCKTAYGADAEKIGEGIAQLLNLIMLNAPETKILLVSPIYLGEGVGEEGFDSEFDEDSVVVSKELPEVYRSIANKHHIHFLAASDYASPSRVDREHMDAEGHSRLAVAVFNKLADMLHFQDSKSNIVMKENQDVA